MRKYGWKPDLPDHRDFRFDHLKASVVTPDLVDLRPKMPAVYDQGDLGACSSHAWGANFQFDQIKQGVPNWVPSRLQIYWYERYLEGTTNEDSGAQIRDGVKALVKWGTIPETLWPYDVTQFKKKPTAKVMKMAADHQVLTYARVAQTEAALEQVLARGYPVVFGFMVYSSFESEEVAKTGMVPMPTKNEKDLGGHAVVLVGYDRVKKLFIVRNSWGADFGDKGYFYMPFDYVLNPDLASDFWVAYTVEDTDGK